VRLTGPWRVFAVVAASVLVVAGALLVAAPVRRAVLLLARHGQRVTDVLPPAAAHSQPASSPVPSATTSPTTSASAASSSGAPSSVPVTEIRSRSTLVGLGDSVPAGSACGCVPFVARLGQQLATDRGQPVTAINDATGGEDSSELLTALTQPTRIARDVSTANIVTITIAANDVAYSSYASGSCGGDDGTACYRPEVQALSANVSAILRRIQALRGGRPTTVLVTGYWNVWQDGRVARSMGAEFVQVSHLVTTLVNQGLQQAATSHGALFVDLAKPFTAAGPDDTGLLAADGDHPNAAGHQLIADVLTQAVLAGT